MQLPVSPHTISRRLDEIGLFGCVQETEHDLFRIRSAATTRICQ